MNDCTGHGSTSPAILESEAEGVQLWGSLSNLARPYLKIKRTADVTQWENTPVQSLAPKEKKKRIIAMNLNIKNIKTEAG